MPLDTRPHPEKIHPTAFVAPGAVVVGDVTLAAESSLWFGVVARGDTDAIVVGPQSNVQDGCILHADAGEPCRLGARVSLGHGAIVHAATVEDDVLIGMHATVLNRAHIGSGSLIAAGSLVPPGAKIPPGSLVMGMPARVARPVTPQDTDLIRRTAEHYVEYSRVYRQGQTPQVSEPGEATAALVRLLGGLGLCEGLSEPELARLAGICQLASFRRGEVLTTPGVDDSDTFVVQAGLLEVTLGEMGQGTQPTQKVIHLGEGQVVGERALIDHEPRSATVRCVSDTCSVVVIACKAFEQLVRAEHHIGLVVYRNLAADLSAKLRH